jgi:hypothetical protein
MALIDANEVDFNREPPPHRPQRLLPLPSELQLPHLQQQLWQSDQLLGIIISTDKKSMP